DGERTGPSPVPNDGDAGDSPVWLQQAMAEKSSAAKTKENYKSTNPLKGPPANRSDIQYNKLQQPLESRNIEMRVQRLVPEPSAPWRFLVPKKSDRTTSSTTQAERAAVSNVPTTETRTNTTTTTAIAGEAVPIEVAGEVAPLPPDVSVGTYVPSAVIPA